MIDPDAALMHRYARGDSNAFDALFARYDGAAYAFFLRRSRCPDRAADLHQELFLRIHRFRDRFDSAQRFSPWFFEVARNVWHDDLRRRHRLPLAASEESFQQLQGGEDPERRTSQRELASLLLADLDPFQREVVWASAVEGETYPDLAARLGKSVSAIKQIGSRSLRRLRELGGKRR